MSHGNIYEVNDNQMIIKLSKEFKDKMKVLVTVNNVMDVNTSKLLLLKQAFNDPLFLADIEAVGNDFDLIGREGLLFIKDGLFTRQTWIQLLVLSRASLDLC
jgi:hypothetical protein